MNLARRSLLLVLLMLASTRPSSSAETQWWRADTQKDHEKSETEGVVIAADGTLSLGPVATSWSADSLRTVWAVLPLADGSVALAGDRGRIDRWTASGGVRPWVRLADGQVLSMASDGDGLVAGTGPTGLVYRVSAKGDTTRLASTGERYVWGIVPGAKGTWWLATGTRGRLLRLEGSRTRIAWDSDASNLTALLSDGAEGVYTGGDARGRVVHARRSGELRTLFDAPEDEIRALARSADGTVWAAALSSTAVSGVSVVAGDGEDGPAPQRAAVSGGRAVIYRIAPEGTGVSWWSAPQPFVFALATSPEGPIAATGNRAGIYQVTGAQQAGQWLAPPQGQVTALASGAKGEWYAATSNPASLWRVGPGTASKGTLTASAQDLRRFSRIGRLRWSGTGSPRFWLRVGNTEEPDTTWESWTEVASDGKSGRALLGRYAQWKAELSGAPTRIDAVSFASRELNLPPRVDEVTVAPQAEGIRDGELGTRSEAVTQTLPGGQKVEYSVNFSPNKALRDLPSWARGLRTLQWRASDANADPLRFQVQVRDEATRGEWVTVGKDLDQTMHSWDTRTLPDGRYRVRVLADDARGNAVGEELTAEGVSEVFEVDNTPPSVTTLDVAPVAGGLRVTVEAADERSPLWRLEVSVDDGDWRTIAPPDGTFDEPRERVSFTLPGLAKGEHLVSVRAVDLAGNPTTRAVRGTVAR